MGTRWYCLVLRPRAKLRRLRQMAHCSFCCLKRRHQPHERPSAQSYQVGHSTFRLQGQSRLPEQGCCTRLQCDALDGVFNWWKSPSGWRRYWSFAPRRVEVTLDNEQLRFPATFRLQRQDHCPRRVCTEEPLNGTEHSPYAGPGVAPGKGLAGGHSQGEMQTW